MNRSGSTDQEISARAVPAAEKPGDRDFTLGVLSGTAGAVAQDFLHPELILAGLVYAMTGSKVLVALVTIINKGASLAPQLLVSSFIEHHPRRRPYFILVACMRTLAVGAMAAAMWLLTEDARTRNLALLFGAYLVFSTLGGSQYVIFMDMVGRAIPHRRVGSFFGLRHFLGGILSIFAGIAVVQPILSHIELPKSYLVLTIVGMGLVLLSQLLWALTREQPGPKASRRTTLAESLRRGFKWIRTERNYRLFFLIRIAFRINHLGLAFFIPYGADRLGKEDSAAGVALLGGLMVAVFKLSRVIASAVWGRVADNRGFHVCLIGSGIGFTLAPLVALAAPMFPETFSLSVPGLLAPINLPFCVYLLALAAIGAASQAMIIGGNRFLINSAPSHRRISYVGFLNTVTSPLALLPLAAAYLAEWVGVTTLFGLIVCGGLLAMIAATRMTPETAAGPAEGQPLQAIPAEPQDEP